MSSNTESNLSPSPLSSSISIAGDIDSASAAIVSMLPSLPFTGLMLKVTGTAVPSLAYASTWHLTVSPSNASKTQSFTILWASEDWANQLASQKGFRKISSSLYPRPWSVASLANWSLPFLSATPVNLRIKFEESGYSWCPWFPSLSLCFSFTLIWLNVFFTIWHLLGWVDYQLTRLSNSWTTDKKTQANSTAHVCQLYRAILPLSTICGKYIVIITSSSSALG